MIWSVSTLLRRSGRPVPVCWVNFSTSVPFGPSGERRQVGRRGEGSGDGGGGRDQRRHQVRATALALPALEVAVRRGGAALSGLELVGVHAQAHRATGPAPLTTGLFEHDVETFILGLEPHAHRARYDEQPGVLGDLAALDHLGGGAEV